MKCPYPVPEPQDGFNKMEKLLLRQLIIQLYQILPTSDDRFIVMAIFEMGYSQDIVATILGKSQVMVSTRIKTIRTFLKNHPSMATAQ